MANTKSLTLVGGSAHYLSRSNDSVLQNLVNTLTIEIWSKYINGPVDLVSRYKDVSNGKHFILGGVLGGGSAKAQFTWKQTNQSSELTLAGSTIINDGSWHHIAATYNNNGSGGGPEQIIYVDTVQDAINTGSGGAVSLDSISQTLVINGHLNSSGSIYGYQNVQIDEIRIWSTVRTATEIATNWKRQLAGTESGLVAYYKLNDAYTDATSNALTLSVSGTPSFTTDVPFADTTTTSTSTTTTSTSSSTTTTSTSSSTSTTTSTSTSTSTTTTSTTTTRTTTSTTTTSTSTTTTSTSTTTTSTSSSTTTSTSTSTTMTIDLKIIVEKVK